MPRIRFSLLNLLLLFSCVALAITSYRLGNEIRPLRVENKRLNEERGTLVFDDDTKVHAIRVPDRYANNSGTFRVFVPKGKTYVAVVAVNNIPKDGIPEVKRSPPAGMSLGQAGANAFASLPPGEHRISLVLRHPRNGCPQIIFSDTEQIGHGISVSFPAGEWPDEEWQGYHLFGDSVGRTTETVDAGQRLVLLRDRREPSDPDSISVSYVRPNPDYPMDGMMLWIEPL